MPSFRQITLSDKDRHALMRMRDTSSKAYLRECAAAILKVDDGTCAAHVARHGLLRRRAEDTVYAWLDRFETDGIAGLQVRAGRGRKPVFSPLHPTATAARDALLQVVRRDPRAFGIPDSRWTLARIREVVDWLRTTSLPGIHQLFDRLRISYKRGRDHVQSPDPDYLAKLAAIAVFLERAQTTGGKVVTLYLDEITYYRQPTLACAYEEVGKRQPLAERSYQANTPTRIVGTLDPGSGRVLYLQHPKIGVADLVKFFQSVRDSYTDADRLNLVVDNWPVHFHPDLLVALEPQENPWPKHLPARWATTPSPAAVKRWGQLCLPIQLRPLPTYASWTNPIEKLWRKLRQEVLHLHRLADRLDELRKEVTDFLDQYAQGSLNLLRYVGLVVPS